MSQPVSCKYYVRGACSKGSRCTFSHDANAAPPTPVVCQFFLQGNCTYGTKCTNIHPLGPSHRVNSTSGRSGRGGSPHGSKSRTSSKNGTPPTSVPASSSHVPVSPAARELNTAQPTQVCPDFAMSQGCHMHGCALSHHLSSDSYKTIASHVETKRRSTPTQSLCYLYFAFGKCPHLDASRCSLRHQLSVDEFYFLLQAPVSTMALPTIPPSHDYASQVLNPAFDPPRRPPLPPTPPSSSSYPSRSGGDTRVCRYFLEGNCRRGDSCTYRHSQAEEQQPTTTWGQPDQGWATESAPPADAPLGTDSYIQGDASNWTQTTVDWWGEDPNAGEEEAPAPSKPTPAPSQSDNREDPSKEPEDEEEEEDPWGTSPQEDEDHGPVHTEGQHMPEDAEESLEAENPAEDTWGAAESDAATQWMQAGYDESWPPQNEEPPTAEQLPPKEDWGRGPICRFFAAGHCRAGDLCDRRHDPEESTVVDTNHGIEPAPEDSPMPETTEEVSEETGVLSLEGRKFASVFNCTVLYGPGAVPERLATSFDPRRVILENIPASTTDEALNELISPYAQDGPEDVSHRFSDDDPSSMIASILMPASQDALHAAVALNGNNFRSRRLTARVDNTPDLPLCADAPGSRTIKITWPSPKRCLWLVYDSITEAKAMVAEFDKPTSSLLLPMFKRKLKAEFKRPKSNQTHSFMVQVNDVWLNVDPEEVKTALKCTLVEPNEPTYTESPLQKFYDRLTSIGAVSMDVVPYDGTKARATAFATFQQASRVQQAVEALDKQTPDYIAKGLVRAEPCFYTSYEVFGGLFEMVRADMEALQAGLPACTVSISQGAEPGDMVVRMGASDAQQFTRMKLRLDSLLCGELVTDNGRLVWDEYFQLESCEPRLKSLMVTSNAYVERDFLHEGVRVHGTRAKRETAKDGVIRLVKRAATAQAMISLPRRLLRSLLGAGLDKLHAEFEAKRIGLDLVTRTLAVRPTTYVDQVQERITEMVEEIREPETDDLAGHCGLCDLSVEGEGQTLGCGHVYDSECFERLLKAYIRPGFTGLRCVARVAGLEGECGAFISNETYAEVLDEEYRSYLHEAALNAYLKGPFGYGLRHCPKTHCPGVYRVLEQIPEGTGNQCPFCERWICPSCCSDFHEGVSCEEYQKMAREVRDAF